MIHSTNSHGPVMSRRSVLGVAAAGLGTMALAGCGGSGGTSGAATAAETVEGAFDAQGAELVVSTWGFNSDQVRELVYAPFEKAYNCKVVDEQGNNGERLAKLEQKPEDYDVVQLSDYYMEQAISKGLIATVDRSKLTNMDGLYDKVKSPNGDDYAPAYTMNRIGIVYDTATVSKPITSWADLWRDDLKGLVTIPDYTTTAGPMMLDMASKVLGQELTAENADAAFKKLAELKPNIVKFFTKSSDVVNMFNQGEVSVAVVQDFSSQSILEASDDFQWVDPSEGTWGSVNVTDVSAKAKNPDLALAFVNYKLAKDSQQRALDFGDGPTRPDVELTDEQKKSMVSGQDVVDTMEFPDLKLLLANTQQWADKWNKELNTSSAK